MQVYELVGIKGAGPEFEPSPEMIRLCQMTDHAFAAFDANDWVQAEERFRAVTVAFPKDKLSRVMALRCFQAAHPELDELTLPIRA